MSKYVLDDYNNVDDISSSIMEDKWLLGNVSWESLMSDKWD